MSEESDLVVLDTTSCIHLQGAFQDDEGLLPVLHFGILVCRELHLVPYDAGDMMAFQSPSCLKIVFIVHCQI
ncbi:hypothetical protein R1flu_026878 [Riccia fluitans]|uniref:Uncharacterized protein n=1 Tax=Riccia fluitans TaxID=41844 RepID=A0ABD1XHQ0_9MARC